MNKYIESLKLKWIPSDTDNKHPSEIKVGDYINGRRIVEITNLVDGKPTYASSFIVEVETERKGQSDVGNISHKD